ncbi:SCO2522 family protein [Solwaraspora sp. WMMD792]|uniref:SCO2522 family protein n=1 Tax=Solwaraspora sp. WMMD792 TaxID=3016099 RepID=UPI002417E4DA|nr:SCO2522 family protein [Solwaraspora sp. WMMD792]MDG4772708.1 SCO2522 family protein [Solwaraspora sp. WMMD792]
MTVTVAYEESTAGPRMQQAALAHVSVELGHLYAEDFERGPDYLTEHFAQVRPWLEVVSAQQVARTGRPARLSTCFLIDDYFTPFGSPRQVFEQLQSAARASGVQLDHIARESGCVLADGVRLAELVLDKLVSEPTPNTTGARPPTAETGWLANGLRSAGTDQAMSFVPWTPPRENARNRHSIFVDVELWDDQGEDRRWACTYLAAVWQLARLGVLRDKDGDVAVQAYKVDELPDQWADLPAVVQVNPKANPFTAYRTFSILNSRYLPVELAARIVLGQVAIDDHIVLQILERARREGITLDKSTVGRIEYAFVN